ncbi:MAG: YbjN domain-containing protein, partial [Rhodospirillales bacterium]|nr:YbjN domain-containing protein [Rhodospirillales bacterium]
MPSLAHVEDDVTTGSNPLDLVEQVVSANEWMFDRRSESELAAEAQGKWCDYGLYFCWSD